MEAYLVCQRIIISCLQNFVGSHSNHLLIENKALKTRFSNYSVVLLTKYLCTAFCYVRSNATNMQYDFIKTGVKETLHIMNIHNFKYFKQFASIFQHLKTIFCTSKVLQTNWKWLCFDHMIDRSTAVR